MSPSSLCAVFLHNEFKIKAFDVHCGPVFFFNTFFPFIPLISFYILSFNCLDFKIVLYGMKGLLLIYIMCNGLYAKAAQA